jgi:glycosyltransferase involved in cell wall biosynthesis
MRKAFRSGDTLSLAHAWSARGFEFAWWLKHRFGVPASGTLHDHPSARFHGNTRRRIMRLSSNRLDGLVAVSRAVADALAGCRAPVTVIHNGVCDVPREPEPHPSVRVGFLGMNAMAKGIPLVADWIDQCLPGADIQWNLFGNPPSCQPALMARLQSHPPGLVVLRGRVAAEAIFNAIDILVHASTQFDSLPTVLIEAARAGIPCVASTLGGAPEIVNDGETGFLFDPSEPQAGLAALKCLFADPQRRLTMGRAARRRFEQHFQAGTMAAGYRKFWDGLLAGQTVKD